MELYLFGFIPKKDVKPLAKDLIAKFGDIGGVASAPREQLLQVNGVGEVLATGLSLLLAISGRMAREGVIGKPVVSSWSALVNYCRTAMQHARTEEFRVLFLDKKNRLIADEVLSKGTVDHTPVYPREVLKRALAHEASALILVHNHPSGDPTPSGADVTMTKAIADAAKPFDIVLHDHLVIGRETTASFRTLGLL